MTALLEQAPVIIRSRLRPPDRHPDEMLRPRLLARLDAYDEPVILLAALPGSGKTVVLSQWMRSPEMRCAWVSLGPTRAGLCGVWSAILQTLEPLCDDRCHTPLRDRSDERTLLNRVIPELLNRLTGAQPLVLVLDGLDAVVEPRAKESVTQFVLHLPAHVRTVLSTNRPDGGPVALLRASGRLGELPADELRFTRAEGHELLEVVARRLVAECEAIRVHRAVDGWAVGLRLAGLALRQGPTGPVPAEVLGYLRAEVLEKATPHERAAIVQSSVLTELRSARIDVVAGPWATRALASFSRSSLFLRPTADGWACHPALRAAAAEYLSESAPALRSTLHSRASRHLDREGDLLGAAEHAREAGKPREACELLAAAWPAARPCDVLERATRFGADLIGAAAHAGAAAALAQGNAELALQLLTACDPRGQAVRGLAHLQLGDLVTARACIEASRDAGQPGTWCTVVAQLVAGYTELWDGCLDSAEVLLAAAAASAADLDYSDAMVRALDGMVACAVTRGRHDRARAAAGKAIATYAADPHRATYPVISAAYLEPERHDVAGLVGVEMAAPDGGPHPAAFAESLRASAARTGGHWIAYRFAQSRGRARLSVEQAGALLRTLLADEPCDSFAPVADAANRLTNRERIVLKALAGPLTLREIAREFHVSHNTIKTQVSSLFRKLDAHDRAAAVRTATERGLTRSTTR